jgi:hypothetical protein
MIISIYMDVRMNMKPMKKTCLACRGNKKINGLGFFEQKCSSCEGTGWVEQSLNEIEEYGTPVDLAEMPNLEPLKRAGRPKRVNHD